MNKIVGALLLLGLLILPAALVVGFSYTGSAHPIERSVIEDDYFLEESTNDVEVLFFGFAGCATVCPSSLAKIASVLDSEQLKQEDRTVGGLFIDVKATTESGRDISNADQYGRAFSSRIRGYTPDMESYRQLADEFIIRLYESRGDKGQISHTDHFFILVRDGDQWTIERVLNNQIDESHMIDIIAQSMKNL
ncbi:SCO family protein [Rhodohalobacter sp. 8-1]|uniref:SCO family protein n=1 Tax=Rhodohalobacter sp. 8-1 TaxID=3131972 RepID=UPI0030ECF899